MGHVPRRGLAAAAPAPACDTARPQHLGLVAKRCRGTRRARWAPARATRGCWPGEEFLRHSGQRASNWQRPTARTSGQQPDRRTPRCTRCAWWASRQLRRGGTCGPARELRHECAGQRDTPRGGRPFLALGRERGVVGHHPGGPTSSAAGRTETLLSVLACRHRSGADACPVTAAQIPPALSAVPRPLLGVTGSLVARYAIASLLPSFLDLLAADYRRWGNARLPSHAIFWARATRCTKTASEASLGATAPIWVGRCPTPYSHVVASPRSAGGPRVRRWPHVRRRLGTWHAQRRLQRPRQGARTARAHSQSRLQGFQRVFCRPHWGDKRRNRALLVGPLGSSLVLLLLWTALKPLHLRAERQCERVTELCWRNRSCTIGIRVFQGQVARSIAQARADSPAEWTSMLRLTKPSVQSSRGVLGRQGVGRSGRHCRDWHACVLGPQDGVAQAHNQNS